LSSKANWVVVRGGYWAFPETTLLHPAQAQLAVNRSLCVPDLVREVYLRINHPGNKVKPRASSLIAVSLADEIAGATWTIWPSWVHPQLKTHHWIIEFERGGLVGRGADGMASKG